MKADKRDVLRVLIALGGPHDWLLPKEWIHFSQPEDEPMVDNIVVCAWLESPTRSREVRGHLSGRLWRQYSYTGQKSFLVDALRGLHDHLVNRLRLTFDHALQALALRALNDTADLQVFMDALLERGEIPQHKPEEQALGFARSIVAPLIFGTWQETRWPFNDALTYAGFDIDGPNGPIRVYTHGLLEGPIANIRVMGGMGIATDT